MFTEFNNNFYIKEYENNLAKKYGLLESIMYYDLYKIYWSFYDLRNNPNCSDLLILDDNYWYILPLSDLYMQYNYKYIHDITIKKALQNLIQQKLVIEYKGNKKKQYFKELGLTYLQQRNIKLIRFKNRNEE